MASALASGTAASSSAASASVNQPSGQNVAFQLPPLTDPTLPPPPASTSNPGQLLCISGGSIPYFITPTSGAQAPLSQSER